jgi:hypothetical protein
MSRSPVATAALRAPLAAPPCPGCRGGGEVNGVECRDCGGSSRAGVRIRRWGLRKLAHKLATPAGRRVGVALNWSKTVPGIGGAAALTFGVSVIGHAIWHWVPAYAVAAILAGTFGLLIDRRL